MKKLFLLISAFLLAATVSAKEIEIGSATSNIISTTIADAGTEDGDVIVLTDNGPYVEAVQINFSKSITLRAKAGKTPVIAQQYYCILTNSAQVSIFGIKFDGSLYNSVGANDHCFRCGDASANKTLYMEDCEITSFKTYIFYIKGGNNLKSLRLKDCTFSSSKRFFYTEDATTIDLLELDGCELYSFSEKVLSEASAATLSACNITDCYFHNNTSYCMLLENTAEKSLSISNSSFVDNNTGLSGNSVVETKNTTGSVLVNHCTFYNCPVNSSSYGTVKFVSPDAVVSNSIFAMPSSIYQRAIHMPDHNDVNNCLTYNYTYDTDGIRYGIDKTACVAGNPYFMNTNPANYDFTIWTTSPAHGTADDGYDLGDYLRWHTDPATHVSTINITADDANSLKAAVDAALPGDQIILAAGTYEESENISLDKEITIKAANAANVIVKPVGSFAIGNAAAITIQNIKFNGTSHTASNFIYAADALSNSLSVEGCEFYNFSKPVIYASDSKLISTCTVNDCQFYDNTHSCIGLKNSAAANLTVSNSTFKNNDASGVGDGNGIGIVESKTATGTMLVDHCTFYNCKVWNTDFGITKVASPNATVSNCIFAMPTSTGSLRTVYIPSGLAAGTTVTNCIMHNFTYDSNIGVPDRSGSTIAHCSTADPLFTDAANGDFSYAGNWNTMSISPARGAGTDNSDLGDPKWYSNEVLPSTSFAAAYDLLGTKAQLKGNIELNASNHIKYKGSQVPGTAKWKLHIGKECHISAVADRESESTSGCTLTLTVKDADGNEVSAVTAARSDNDKDINFPGSLYIPEEGDYSVELTNSVEYSGAILEKITLAYMGGAVQTIAADVNTNLPIGEAWYSGCTRADGGISFPSSSTSSAWMKWNTAASATKYYDVTVNITATNGHSIGVYVYEEGDPEPATPTIKESHSEVTGDLALELGRVNLVVGKNYIVMVKNASSGSTAKVTGVTFAPVLSTVTALPGTINFNNAVLSAKAFVQDGKLYFNEIGDSNPVGQYAQWEVSVAEAGAFLFTMDVSSTNAQSYKITIKDSENNVIDAYEKNPDGSGNKTIKHYFNFAAGNYFVKVENTYAWSQGHLVSLAVSKPSIVTLDEAATTDDVIMDNNRTEDPINVQIIRTITAGMYNTFCLPFDLDLDEFKGIFGEDAELKEMESADIEDDYILNLNFSDASSVYRCKPYLIKTSRNIVNPAFSDVTIKADESDKYITTGTRADFISTLIKAEVPEGENNLWLGQNNTLFFSASAQEILGFRAYFHIKAPAGISIRKARIVTPDKIPTDIQIVNGEIHPLNETMKVIENGQLIIIRDGVRYNVMGVRVK